MYLLYNLEKCCLIYLLLLLSYPFEISSMPVFIIINIFATLSFTLLAYIYFTLDLLLISLVLYSKSMYRHLNWMIERIDANQHMKNQEFVQKKLVNCIILHNKIKNYCRNVNDIMSFVIFIHYSFLLLQSSIIMFQTSLVSLMKNMQNKNSITTTIFIGWFISI